MMAIKLALKVCCQKGDTNPFLPTIPDTILNALSEYNSFSPPQ